MPFSRSIVNTRPTSGSLDVKLSARRKTPSGSEISDMSVQNSASLRRSGSDGTPAWYGAASTGTVGGRVANAPHTISTAIAAPVDLAAGTVRCIQLFRRFALFHPSLERADFVEHIGTFTAAAVAHSRRQEQPHVVGRLGRAAQVLDDAFVVLDGIHRRDIRVAP